MLDAIGRTLVRMFFTRRHLLEWETAAAVEWRVSNNRWSLLWQLWLLPTIALVIGTDVAPAGALGCASLR